MASGRRALASIATLPTRPNGEGIETGVRRPLRDRPRIVRLFRRALTEKGLKQSRAAVRVGVAFDDHLFRRALTEKGLKRDGFGVSFADALFVLFRRALTEKGLKHLVGAPPDRAADQLFRRALTEKGLKRAKVLPVWIGVSAALPTRPDGERIGTGGHERRGDGDQPKL